MPGPKTQPAILLARDAWIKASTFHGADESEIVRELHKRVRKSLKNGNTPAVVFDLDSTLYEVAPRTFLILREAADSLSKKLPTIVRRAFSNLVESKVGYSVQDTFRNLGLPLGTPAIARAWEDLRQFWWDRFFSNSYLKHDRPYPNAKNLVCSLSNQGAHILYLTGREGRQMKVGTRENLLRDGFPLDDARCLLQMKRSNQKDDSAFKARIARDWSTQFDLIACLENEPRNLSGLYEAVPQAMPIFVHTVCSDKPAPVIGPIYRMHHFPDIQPRTRRPGVGPVAT